MARPSFMMISPANRCGGAHTPAIATIVTIQPNAPWRRHSMVGSGRLRHAIEMSVPSLTTLRPAAADRSPFILARGERKSMEFGGFDAAISGRVTRRVSEGGFSLGSLAYAY